MNNFGLDCNYNFPVWQTRAQKALFLHTIMGALQPLHRFSPIQVSGLNQGCKKRTHRGDGGLVRMLYGQRGRKEIFTWRLLLH